MAIKSKQIYFSDFTPTQRFIYTLNANIDTFPSGSEERHGVDNDAVKKC